ncbi:MAG: hypothetical protein JNN13_14580 [Planctomycetes bacterium]|nr:hypothetical protein [Planctomycetota bacterium]
MPFSRAAALLLSMSIAAACSAPPTRVEARSFGQPRPLAAGSSAPAAAPVPGPVVAPEPAVAAPVPPTAAAATAPSGEGAALPATMPELDPLREEAELRHLLATTSDPTEPALDLAALLLDEERPAEALQVLDTAAGRRPSPLLRLARAGVLRDLGRRHLAVAELTGLVRELGAGNLGPGVLFELAELQWLEGAGADAAATLAQLRAAHQGDPWCREHHRDLDGLAAEIAHDEGPQRLRVRDLLGNLRGAPLATVRVATLERLVAIADAEPALTLDLAGRAVAIAAADASPAVRAAAVRLARPVPESVDDFCRLALDDAAALVRRFAASRAAELLGARAVPLLLAQLERESDPAAFAALDAALAASGGASALVTASAADTAAGRLAVVTQWRRRCANGK